MEKKKFQHQYDAPTVSARFIYRPTTTHDDSATIHHGGATNAHDASTIRYGASTIQAGSATVASRPPTNLHDLVVVMPQSHGVGGTFPPPSPGDSLQKYDTNIIIYSIFDEIGDAIKKKSSGKITTVSGPTG